MKKQITFLFCTFFLCIASINAAEYWVSPSGNDSNDGKSLSNAFATPNKATSVAVAGDIIWVKGGQYLISTGISCSKAGTASAPIRMWAVAGEKPVFDCQPLIDGGKTSNNGRGMQLTKDYWHIKGITICNTNDRGVTIGSSSASTTGVIFEGCVIHHANNDGIAFMGSCTNTLVLNCDSHHNWERGRDGNNGDGFAAKAGGTGNVFRGCRAWNNSDDGWDVYGGANPVLIDSCYSFKNGYNVFGYTGSWSGNGNGYKLGGTATNAEHVVTNSVAFENRSKGFDQNHATKGQTVINCTGYNNHGENGNFSFYETPTDGVLGKNIMRNNLSYKGRTHNLAAGTEEITNSWNLGLSFTDDMFVNLDTDFELVDRDPYTYKLPNTGLFRLKANNPAIDMGTPQTGIRLGKGGIDFIGNFPDLGAFEYDPEATTSLITTTPDNGNIISESYYTISGIKVNEPAKGIFIKKTFYENGAVITTKLIQQ